MLVGLFLAGMTLLVAAFVIGLIGFRREPWLALVLSSILCGFGAAIFVLLIVLVSL